MSVAIKIKWDNRAVLRRILGDSLSENSPLRHDGPRPEYFEVMVSTTDGEVKARMGEWLIFDNGAGVRIPSIQVMVEKGPRSEAEMEYVDRRITTSMVKRRACCKIHGEPLVQTNRCEVPANMNGAPRLVCPECLEERAERMEVAIRVLEIEKEETAQALIKIEASVHRIKNSLVSTIKSRSTVARSVEILDDGALPETPAPINQRPPEQTPPPPRDDH